MALHDEHADILGGPILQRPVSGLFTTFSQYHLIFKSLTLLGLGLLAWIACAHGLEHLKKHRELRYRKAMRRKHGIPDSDCRPFAVAYAAAKRAHLEREAQDRKKTTNYVSDHNSLAVDQRTYPQKDARGLRRRVPETTVQHRDHQPPQKHVSLCDLKCPDFCSPDFAGRYDPNLCQQLAVPEALLVEKSPVRRVSGKDPVKSFDDHEESRKRSFEDESDVEHETIKKSRIDGKELIDGDEQADWYAQYSDIPPRPAPKESPYQQPEDNYVHTNGQERSKRVNDLLDEDHEPVDEDEVTELKAVVRGRKRDRTEAGPSFGGDDEEDVRNGRASHYRKRRTVLQRTETPTRGQKRDRGTETPESESEGVDYEVSRRGGQRSSKKKRGKKAASDGTSEVSMEDSHESKDPLCGGRGVGNEWEADGIRYKVGDTGERLRLTLVKKVQNKYHMPQDSQHPDRSAALEIYVETWMTEEQYKQAERKRELAWQEASSEPSGSKTPDVLDSPTKSGKSLLWDSVKGSPARRPFRQFMPPGGSTRTNPFDQWQLQPTLGRRVASSSTIASPILPGVADSPTRPGFRGFSKWEKQDREADAMARIRAKIEEQKKPQGTPHRPVELPTSATAPELSTKPLSVPTITLTPAPVVSAEGKSNDCALASKSNTSTSSFATSPSSIDPTKVVASSTSTNSTGFSLPSTSVPATTPSTRFPSAPTVLATTSSVSLPPFSFAKPPQPPSATPTFAPSVTPNLFGKGSVASIPPSTLGSASLPQPSLGESASKPALFPFAKPDTSSPTASPYVAVPPTTKSQVPTFGPTSSSSPSPVIFAPLATAKPELVVPLPASPSAPTSESSKSAAPLFSFEGSSASSTTPIPVTSSAPSAPKFSFGQPSTILTSSSAINLAPGTASHPKPTFKFGQTLSGRTDNASMATLPTTDESKKSAAPASVFSPLTRSDEPLKPSPFGTTSAFGGSTLSSPSTPTSNPFGRPAALDSEASTLTPAEPTSVSGNNTIIDNVLSSTRVGAITSGNAPVFSFGGTSNTGAKSAEGSKPLSLFGGVVGGSKAVSMFGGSSTEGKPTFTFNAPAEGSKPPFLFGSNKESPKPPPVFGSSAETPKPTFAFGGSSGTPKPASAFGIAVEGSKPTSAFGATAETKLVSGHTGESAKSTALPITSPDNSLPSNTTDGSKPVSTPGSTPFGPSSSMSATFTFGKRDDVASNTSILISTQAKPATHFTLRDSPGATASMFGQSSTFTMSGNSSQSAFGKPANTTPSAFGFAGTGAPSSPSTLTFGKPAAQNQKQEQ